MVLGKAVLFRLTKVVSIFYVLTNTAGATFTTVYNSGVVCSRLKDFLQKNCFRSTRRVVLQDFTALAL
jgi:hypothetical protein